MRAKIILTVAFFALALSTDMSVAANGQGGPTAPPPTGPDPFLCQPNDNDVGCKNAGDFQNLCNAEAEPGNNDCRFIKDKDLQNFCNVAAGGNDGSDCADISNADTQNLCNMFVNPGSDDCKFIVDPDLQNFCNSMAGSVDDCGFITDNADLANLCTVFAGVNTQNCKFIK